MPKNPCMDCPYRKIMCHDRCDDYLSFHDELVAAKKSLREANDAINYLIGMSRKRAKKARVKK